MEHEKKPLTLDQLRQMDGQPVWIEDEERFGLVSVAAAGAWKGIPFVRFCENGCGFEYNVETRGLKLYTYKPVGFEKWRCGICEVPTHWMEWSEAGYDYCPYCGRPLTPAAQELLERRLRG